MTKPRSQFKAAMFDTDGVVVLAPENFSRMYAMQRGLDPASFEPFFKGEFGQALVGQADLADLIRSHNDIWQWNEDPEKLLSMWFESENRPNQPLLAEIALLRAKGVPVYMATNQERHREKYVREIMFPGVFDQILASCELGYKKPSHDFFRAAMDAILAGHPGITTGEVAYFDDEPVNVEAASQYGLSAYLYRDVAQVAALLN